MIWNAETKTVTLEASDLRAYNHDKSIYYQAEDDQTDEGQEHLELSSHFKPFYAWLSDKAYSNRELPHGYEAEVKKEINVCEKMRACLENADNLIIDGGGTESIEAHMFSSSYKTRYANVGYHRCEFKNVTVRNVPEIRAGAFFDSIPVENMVIKDNVKLCGLALTKSHVKNLTLNGFNAECIPTGLCYQSKDLETVKSTSPIRDVHLYAFCECNRLTEIDLSNVTTIETKAFCNTNIDISEQCFGSLRSLGKHALDGCPASKNIIMIPAELDKEYEENLPYGVVSIRNSTTDQSKSSIRDIPSELIEIVDLAVTTKDESNEEEYD